MVTPKKLENVTEHVEHGKEACSDRKGCEHGRILEALDAFLEVAQWDWLRPELEALYQARRELDERWSPDGGELGRGSTSSTSVLRTL